MATKLNEIAIIIIIALSLLLVPLSYYQTYAKSSEEKKIDKALDKVGYKNVCKLAVTTKSNNETQIIYNNSNSKCKSVIPGPPIVVVPPNPPPVPTGEANKTTICLAGDLSGTAVPNAMMKDCNMKIGLGDLGYKSDLSWFKSLNFNKCVIGNHDAPEDGSSSIYKEALAYCGDHWSLKIANDTTLLIGLNTNGDAARQLSFVDETLSQNPLVKTVIVMSHKSGHVFPTAHHPSEARDLYSNIESIIPQGIKLLEISGHNHNLAQSINDKGWFITGSGGKSHYACGTDATWIFCDNKNYGYLKLTIDNNNSQIFSAFYDINNKKLN